MKPVRVLVADEHPLVRAALAAALADERDVEAVAEATSGHDALALARDCDAVLLSGSMTAPPAADVCAALKSADPSIQVLIISPAPDPAILLAAVEAGADGFVSEDESVADLLEALRRVVQGEAVVPPAMLGALLKGLILRNRREERAVELYMRLTRREQEVLALLADGCDHDAIADILVISPQTARTHIQNVLGKLEVHSRLEAAALAVEHGLTERMPLRGAR